MKYNVLIFSLITLPIQGMGFHELSDDEHSYEFMSRNKRYAMQEAIFKGNEQQSVNLLRQGWSLTNDKVTCPEVGEGLGALDYALECGKSAIVKLFLSYISIKHSDSSFFQKSMERAIMEIGEGTDVPQKDYIESFRLVLKRGGNCSELIRYVEAQLNADLREADAGKEPFYYTARDIIPSRNDYRILHLSKDCIHRRYNYRIGILKAALQ